MTIWPPKSLPTLIYFHVNQDVVKRKLEQDANVHMGKPQFFKIYFSCCFHHHLTLAVCGLAHQREEEMWINS